MTNLLIVVFGQRKDLAGNWAMIISPNWTNIFSQFAWAIEMNHVDTKYIKLQNEFARNFQPTSVFNMCFFNILIQLLFWISNIEASSKFFIDRKINNCLLTSEADTFLCSPAKQFTFSGRLFLRKGLYLDFNDQMVI